MKNFPRAALPALFVLVLFHCFPSRLLAQFVPGVGTAANGGRRTLGAGASVYEDLPLEAARSYSCSIESGSEPDSASIAIVDTGYFAPSPTQDSYAQIGAVTPNITSGSLSSTQADNRVTITPSTSGLHHLVLVNSSFSDPVSFKVMCLETTLYGGYNTNANPFNFLELTNITGSTITGRVRGFNVDGTPTIDTPFTISANSRQDFDLHTPAGPNKYGSLIVTHGGPFGALKGAVSQYGTSGGGLVLGATVPLKPRSQTF